MEREGEVGGVIVGENGRRLGPDVERGRELGTASELELEESSMIKVVLGLSGFADHEVDG